MLTSISSLTPYSFDGKANANGARNPIRLAAPAPTTGRDSFYFTKKPDDEGSYCYMGIPGFNNTQNFEYKVIREIKNIFITAAIHHYSSEKNANLPFFEIQEKLEQLERKYIKELSNSETSGKANQIIAVAKMQPVPVKYIMETAPGAAVGGLANNPDDNGFFRFLSTIDPTCMPTAERAGLAEKILEEISSKTRDEVYEQSIKNQVDLLMCINDKYQQKCWNEDAKKQMCLQTQKEISQIDDYVNYKNEPEFAQRCPEILQELNEYIAQAKRELKETEKKLGITLLDRIKFRLNS